MVRAPAPERRGYHHGRLEEALVEAARHLLAEKGADGFSLADAARLAGVSPAAPYRHFRDREGLLAEVAREGFSVFAARLAEGLRSEDDPKAALRAMGSAYLGFARAEPGFYSAMFSSGVHPDHADLAARGAAPSESWSTRSINPLAAGCRQASMQCFWRCRFGRSATVSRRWSARAGFPRGAILKPCC
jgi:AcrR family transcriptional regulator